ncbi:MAG: SH3 domain-containing protein, partial [Anaerolineae bacterium]|nr:SH3 domain-containing protein [Anaerolineae bacterium]
VNGERATSGLNRLLLQEYGLEANDDALIETWFGRDQFRSPATMWTSSQPENRVRHPVVEPLARYDVPVYVWAARSVQVHPFVADAEAYPLIFTDTTFGETNRNSFRNLEPEPVELNIGADTQGRLLIGGIGENLLTGSRVALLGDSEMLENIFGLTYLSAEDSGPRYPGNHILADRLVGWLLGVPEADWPDLPDEFTWIALDGDASDWDESLRPVSDDILDTPMNDIKQVRAFYNDQYLYLLIETASETADALRVTLSVEDARVSRQVVLTDDHAAVITADGGETPLPDAGMAVGQAVEVRIPRRAFSSLASITRVCLDQASMGNQDCLEATFRPPLVTDLDPVPVRPTDGPMAFLRNSGNLRAAPSTNAAVLTSLFGRTPVGVLGRNEAGDWIKVHDGRWEGWLALPLVVMSADVERLPVLP